MSSSLGTPLPPSFYEQDPLIVARSLLGAYLIHELPSGESLVGRVVETEAYRGMEDQACHAKVGITPRTETMFGPAGHAYIYLIYGMYHLFNVVAWPEGKPAGILIRAIEPISGIEGTTHGPGRLTRAMQIDGSHNTMPVWEGALRVHAGPSIPEAEVSTGPRIGVDYAGEWAHKPWRFWITGHPHLSRVSKK